MKQAAKLLIVLLAVVTAKVSLASSSATTASSATAISQFQLQLAVSQHKPESYPSHGMAMLILRYNETSKEYESTVHNNGPVLQSITPAKSEAVSSVAGQCQSLCFPEKLLQYEVYLYSLPLRSPPVTC